RHVILPLEIAKWLPHHDLLIEKEWRELGLKQSKGWEHYMVHAPEPHILLFKRELNYTAK
ncbi:cyclin-dependent kinases regulatory subunit 1, partial [Spinellus fusiger]